MHDLCATAELIKALNCGHVLADLVFEANWLYDILTGAGITAVIPPKSKRRFPA